LPHFEPINDSFLALDGEVCYVNIAYAMSMSGVNAVEFILDCQFDALPTGGQIKTIMAKLGRVALTVSDTGYLQFSVLRNITTTTAQTPAGTVVAGARYIIRGVDDGATVKLYVNGTLKDSKTSSTVAISNAGTLPIVIGHGVSDFTKLRIFGAQVRQDGIVTARFLARETSGSALRDYSGYNQVITIAGAAVEGTNYWWGSAWSREPMFTGGVTL